MYDHAGFNPLRPRPAVGAGFGTFRLPWWILGLAGMTALLLALWVKPAPHRPSVTADVPAREQAAAPLAAGPEHVSVLDLVGKISVAILLVYAVAFGLTRARRAGLLAPLSRPEPPAANSLLQLRETLALGEEQGTLFLIEVEGQKMLLGAAADQLQMLWTAASDHTASFTPVVDERPEPRLGERRLTPPTPEEPLFKRGPGRRARRESDWARERSRLIATLMQSE